ncbi:hypothetical protein CCYA_CCYA06G1761 [Cyanidiococcus yangmingshanensis]|nr:hypothetical protein CCYA_CCYA06G1761 [Cyanidiococcus yangmingshanensis]
MDIYGQEGTAPSGHGLNAVSTLNGGTLRTRREPRGSGSVLSTRVTNSGEFTLDYKEITRLILQELEELGFHRTVQVLQTEAGISAQSEEVRHFQRLLLSAEWEKASDLLPELVTCTRSSDGVPNSETLQEPRQLGVDNLLEEARFLLFSHKLYELLCQLLCEREYRVPEREVLSTNQRKIEALQKAAFHCLRHQLAQNSVARRDAWRLNRLTLAVVRVCAARTATNDKHHQSMISAFSPDVCEKIESHSTASTMSAEKLHRARDQLFHQLQKYICKEKTIEKSRLETLLSRALRENMLQACFPYTVQDRPSLLEDFVFNPTAIPNKTWRILKGHHDEVWLVQFSHSGEWLLSAGKDGSIVLWNMDRMRQNPEQLIVSRYVSQISDNENSSDDLDKQGGRCTSDGTDTHAFGVCIVLSGHADAVCAAAWSPDDRIILSAGSDLFVRLWDTQTGRCLFRSEKQAHAITACAWLKNGDRFVTSSTDCNLYVWQIEGCEDDALRDSSSWRVNIVLVFHGKIFNDIAVSSFRNEIIGICTERRICRYDVDQACAIAPCVEEVENMTSLCMSRCEETPVVLVSTSSEGASRPEIHEWDFERNTLVQRYVGHQQGRFVIRSCFGGFRECFVLSGSEDAHVYMWKRSTGQLFARLSGHTGTVNAVSWSPTEPTLFASASDDGTVRLWSTADQTSGPVDMEDSTLLTGCPS